jgi:hypothetical protein
VHNRIIDFVNRIEIIYPLRSPIWIQSKKPFHTLFAYLPCMNKIATSIDQNEITVSIFLDLSKTFDTLYHQILFSKLEHYTDMVSVV